MVSYRRKLYLFGGHCETRALNDLHIYDGMKNSWIEAKTLGDPPSPRYYHSATVLHGKMYPFTLFFHHCQVLQISSKSQAGLISVRIILKYADQLVMILLYFERR